MLTELRQREEVADENEEVSEEEEPAEDGHVQAQNIVKNRILCQLPADELKSVQPWLTPMQLRSNAVLQEQGDPIDHICFPLSGMISLLSVMQPDEPIETGIIGADGLLHDVKPRHRAGRLPRAEFAELVQDHGSGR